MTPPTTKHKIVRILSIVAGAIAVLLVFVLGLVAVVLFNLDLPIARRFAMKELNSVLATQFKGKVTIDRLAHLSIFGVGGVDATILAADGTTVLTGKGVSAHISPFRILGSAFFGKGDIRIGVDTASIDAVDVDLDAQPDGSLKLIAAFDPAKPSPPPTPGSRGIAIALERIAVKHVRAHGTVPGVPSIDADVEALAGSFLSTSAATKLDLQHLTVVARGLPRGISVAAQVGGHLAMPSPSGSSMAVGGTISGSIGQIPLRATVSLDGDALDGVIDVPEVTAEQVRASVEGVPLYGAVSMHAEAHGALANLKVALGAHAGDGTVTLDGLVHAKGALGGSATVTASHLDARTFSKDAPATDVGLRVEAKAETHAEGVFVAEASVSVPEGTAAGQRVPSAALELAVTGRPTKDASPQAFVAHLEGVVREPGAPVAVTADGTLHEGAGRVSFGLKADAPHLSEVTRLGAVGSGSAELTLSGHASFGEKTSFEVELLADAHSFDRPDAHVESVQVAAKAHGSMANPEIQARVVATGLAAAGYKVSRAEVLVAGTPQKGRVAISAVGDGSPDLKVTGDVAIGKAVTVTGLSVGLRRQAEAVTVAVESLLAEGGAFEGKGIVVTGAGAPLLASFRAAPGALALTASTHGFDLGRLAFVVGQDKKAGGKLALNVDLDARRDHGKGQVALDLTEGEWSSFHGMEAHIGMGLDGRHLTGHLQASVVPVGSLDLSDVDVQVGGQGALAATAWKNAWGKLTIAANVDMARATALAPQLLTHVTDVAGRVTLAGHIERDSLSDTTPEIHLSLATEGLAATGESLTPVREPGGPLMVGPATWNLQGMDARVDLAIDGADSAGELAVRVVDKQGVLVSVDFKTDPLPFKELLSGTDDVTPRMTELPISLRVDIPGRELTLLPLLIRPDGVRGGIAATLSMKGSVEKPVVDLSLLAQKIVVRVAPDAPMDGAVNAHYDGANARVAVDVKSPSAQVLSGEANLHAKASDILAARGLPALWGGDVKAKLARFPLGAIGMLSDNQVLGFVTGDLALTGLHEDAAASVNLALEQLKLGKASFSKATVDATLNGKGLNGKVRLDGAGGFLEADASMGMKWGNALVPVSDGTGLQGKVSAKHFPASAAAPFASSALSELSGWVDADANVVLVPKAKPKMSGSVSFTEGIIEAPAIGEEFHAIKAKVTLNEDGLVKLEDVEARGLSGRLTASGSARLDGTTLLGADLTLDIRKGDAIPLDIQGSNLGTAYGNVTVKASGTPDGKTLNVAIAVPHFRVDLPSGSLPRSPQALGDAPSVHMGAYINPDRFLVLAVDGSPPTLVAKQNTAPAPELPAGGGAPAIVAPPPPTEQAKAAGKAPPSMAIEAKIHLGEIEVTRGQQLDVNLEGDLTANVALVTTVRGAIHLKSGKLNVQSKEFAIEKGTITFVGDDPSNPEVAVTAGWPAPDGTRVLANYVGPVKTGKVTLSSEPPRPKNEIVQLILFGTADGSEATPYASKSPSTGTEAGTAVGGLATDGLSKGLDQLTGMDISAKVDTSDSSSPKADIELQVAKDISIQLAYVIVQPPPGDNPDLVYATIDWRFVRNWSLETTFGDAGSTFANMVWQYRY